MELWKPALLFAVGVVAGWINVLAGGGSLLSIPAMVFLGLPGPVANGTNRIGIIAQNIASVWGFFRKGYSDFKLSATLSVCACIGAVFGAMMGVSLDGVWFERTLALIMAGVLLLMMTGAGQKPVAPEEKPKNLVAGHILFVVIGVWAGFIQIGVGFLMMPVLNRLMGIDLVRTNMHKVFIALMFSIVSLIVFMSQVKIEWMLGVALALGNAVGGWLGASSAVSGGEKLIRRVFLLAVAGMAVKLLFF
jgi:uncharacterized protein